jgi:hypothetical protein
MCVCEEKDGRVGVDVGGIFLINELDWVVAFFASQKNSSSRKEKKNTREDMHQ